MDGTEPKFPDSRANMESSKTKLKRVPGKTFTRDIIYLSLSRSPSSALLPFFGGRVPLLKSTPDKKIGYPYSNLSTGGPSLSLYIHACIYDICAIGCPFPCPAPVRSSSLPQVEQVQAFMQIISKRDSLSGPPASFHLIE